ncbi:hypothetical protein CFK39_06540 [Brachybacterium avium]|uniref:Uncharacterized protein n=1 Tax=Brachybacterium avium TaxID=2017485 RepID=A0A220UBZ1_9MICO|nr:hypothetical protein CFK39_06540 [Brachybacterium avium]
MLLAAVGRGSRGVHVGHRIYAPRGGRGRQGAVTQHSAVSEGLNRAGFAIIARGREQCLGDPERCLGRKELKKRKTIAGARLLIGSRMHACLNALPVGTSAIPLA